MSLASQIDALQGKLKISATADEMSDWWDAFKTIESHVELYGGAANKVANTGNLQRSSERLSELMEAIRNGLASPNLSAAIVALGALKGSFSKGTVGVDGWPVKR
jgi:hypothetical protein